MVVLLILLAIVGVFCFFIGTAYMKKTPAPGPEPAKTAEGVVVSQDSIIIPRSASVKIIIRDADPDDITDNAPAAFDIESEEEELRYISDWQRLFAFDTPMEERRLIYEELCESGMYCFVPFEQLFPESLEASVSGSEGSFDEPDPVSVGKEDAGAEQKQTGDDEGNPDAGKPEDAEESPSGSAGGAVDEDYAGTVAEALDGGLAAYRDEVASRSAGSVDENVDEEGRIIYDADNEVLLEEAERERQDEVDEERGICWDYSEADYSDDNAAVLKAITLMMFITDSLKKGLISPELARFAETRLQLKAADDAWNNLLLDQAQSRIAKFSDVDVSIDELDRMVREDVDSHVAAQKVAEKPQAARPRPSVPKFKTTRIDEHGGQLDMVWDRIMGKES